MPRKRMGESAIWSIIYISFSQNVLCLRNEKRPREKMRGKYVPHASLASDRAISNLYRRGDTKKKLFQRRLTGFEKERERQRENAKYMGSSKPNRL